MKKFLISFSAGLFAISLLVAPVATFAVIDLEPADSCRVRSDINEKTVLSLANTKGPDDLSGKFGIKSGQLLPYGPTDPSGKAEHILPDPLPDTLNADQKKLVKINKNFAIICAYSLIEWITGIAFLLIGALSVLVIAYAAFLYITSQGDPGKSGTAKKYLIYAVVGILVAVLANMIPNLIINFLG